MQRLFCTVCMFATLFLVASCAIDPEVISLWGGDVRVPELQGVYTVSAREVRADFSDTVTVVSATVHCRDEPGRTIGTVWHGTGAGDTLLFTLEENPGIGVVAILSASVQDVKRNTYSFSVPFTGYNERIPLLLINEIRTAYSKPRVEYVELAVLSDGNLAGVEIQNTMNTTQGLYEFPACEVRAGEFVLWHLRSVEEGLITETDRIDASGGRDSSPFAWDFWDSQERAPLKSTNVLILRDRHGGSMIDAVLCAETRYDAWPSDALRLAAEEAVAAGAWGPSALITDSICSDSMTATRTLGRLPGSTDTGTASEWIVCTTSGASPGGENSAIPYGE